jgi:hypothetical protein
MKKTMKKQYYIRKRKNISNHKHKKIHEQHGGNFPNYVMNTIETESKNALLPTLNNDSSSQYNKMDPSQLYPLYGNPFQLHTLLDLSLQPIIRITNELYNILKSGHINNPNELKIKLDTMANSIQDIEVKNQVLNFNSQILNVFTTNIYPSMNIISNVISTPISKILENLIKNTYIYLIDSIKMNIINKQNELFSIGLQNIGQIHTGLEFFNDNIINSSVNNLNNKFYTAKFIQEGGNNYDDNEANETNETNEKIHNELLNEINKSLQEYQD